MVFGEERRNTDGLRRLNGKLVGVSQWYQVCTGYRRVLADLLVLEEMESDSRSPNVECAKNLAQISEKSGTIEYLYTRKTSVFITSRRHCQHGSSFHDLECGVNDVS